LEEGLSKSDSLFRIISVKANTN